MAKRVMHIAEAAGGVERYLVTLLTKLKKYPEVEHILVCSDTFDKEKFKGLVRSVILVRSMHNAISFSDIIAIQKVRKVIKHYHPDVVYCHSSKAGAIGRIADIGIPNKLIYNAHGWAFKAKNLSRKRRKFYELAERELARFTDRIVCISENEKRSALQHKICGDDKLTVIRSGIDLDAYRSIHPKSRAELGIPENAFVIGMVGRLTPQKAPDVFVKMTKIVKEKIPEAFFLMVGDDLGDGGFREMTESRIRRVGLEESFLITDWVEDPADYLSVFDVGVLLSRWEGFGLVLPEYMYLQKPIVATKADAIPEVVGDAGLLVEIDDHRQAARAILTLYNNKELRERIIQKEKEQVKKYDAERTAEEHKKVFGL